MGCGDKMGQVLSRYVDNEATPDERRHVEEHLRGCAGCKELLAIFLRNEGVVHKALSQGEYGEAIVDRVMERVTEPQEPEPAEETRWERFMGFLRERPWISVAAAVLVAVGPVAILAAAHASKDSEMRDQLSWLQEKIQSNDRALAETVLSEQRRSEAQATRLRDMHGELIRLRVANAGGDVPGNASAGFFYNGVVVRAWFANQDQFGSFVVWRSEDGANFVKLKEGLLEPEFEDTAVSPGKTYWYKFVGRKRNLESVESVPVEMKAPLRNGLDREKCISIRCTQIGPVNNIAIFSLTRYVNRTPYTYEFEVGLGQPIGRPAQTPSGPVDFSTGLAFDGAETGDETLKLTFAWPKYDDENRPIWKTAGQQDYELRDLILSIRSNKRAVLRPVGAAPGRSPLKVWCDGEILIPLGE